MRPRLLALLVAACALAGCGHDFAPVNPFDPRYDLSIQIGGPDSATSDGQILTFSVATNPEWTASQGVWASSAPGRLIPLGDGRFRVAQANYAGNVDTISVTYGPHVAKRTVRVRQRITSIQLTLQYGSRPDSVWFDALGQSIPIGVAATDSSGAPVDAPATALQLTSRDLQVLTTATDSGVSVANGRTWLVGTLDGVIDSLRVVVRQWPAGFTSIPSSVAYIPLNDTLRVSIVGWRDPLGNPVVTPPPYREFFSFYAYGDSASFSITPDGLITIGSNLVMGGVGVHWRYGDGYGGDAGQIVVYGGYTPP